MPERTPRELGSDTNRRALEQNLRLVFDVVSDALVIHREGRIVYANPAVLRRLGMREDELLGRSPLDFVSRRQRFAVAERIFQTYGHHAVAPALAETLFGADGSEFHAEVTAIPILFEGASATLVHLREVEPPALH